MSLLLEKIKEAKEKQQSFKPFLAIIYSKPKAGKSTIFANIPEKTLYLDLENGTKFLKNASADIVYPADYQEFNAILKEILKGYKEKSLDYKYIVIDSYSKLEEYCEMQAEQIYAGTNIGKSWFLKLSNGELSPESGKYNYKSILNLPKGAGYYYLREALNKYLSIFKSLNANIIILAHMKDSLIDEPDGRMFLINDLDATGKNKNILAKESDILGILYPKGNQRILSFITNKNDMLCGGRLHKVVDKEYKISEKSDDGKITFYFNELLEDIKNS